MVQKKGSAGKSVKASKNSGKNMKKSKNSSKKEKKIKVKDPNQPKRAKSSYLFFAVDKRKEVLQEFPHLATKVAEVATILGKRWATISAKEKDKYIALSETDKRRYIAQQAEYLKKK